MLSRITSAKAICSCTSLRVVEVQARRAWRRRRVTMPSSAKSRLHLVVDEEGLRDRAGVGQAGRLDEDVVELVAPLHQVAEDADEVAADGAADAAVVHLEDLFLGADDELLIDADLAELVLDDGDALAVLLGEDVVEQRGLAGAEEAGEDGDGDARRFRLSVAMIIFSLRERFEVGAADVCQRAVDLELPVRARFEQQGDDGLERRTARFAAGQLGDEDGRLGWQRERPRAPTA